MTSTKPAWIRSHTLRWIGSIVTGGHDFTNDGDVFLSALTHGCVDLKCER